MPICLNPRVTAASFILLRPPIQLSLSARPHDDILTHFLSARQKLSVLGGLLRTQQPFVDILPVCNSIEKVHLVFYPIPHAVADFPSPRLLESVFRSCHLVWT